MVDRLYTSPFEAARHLTAREREWPALTPGKWAPVLGSGPGRSQAAPPDSSSFQAQDHAGSDLQAVSMSLTPRSTRRRHRGPGRENGWVLVKSGAIRSAPYLQYPAASPYPTAKIPPTAGNTTTAAASRTPARIGRGQKLTTACTQTMSAHGMIDAAIPWAHHGQ